MTGREVVARGVAVVVMPVVIVVMFAIVTMAMTAAGYGPGVRFVSDMASGSSTAVESAGVLVNVNRVLVLPLLIVGVAVATGRSAAAGAGVGTAALAAGVIGGYPSLPVMALLALVYAAIGYGIRGFRRRSVVRT